MHQPNVPDNPPAVLGTDALRELLKQCAGKGFEERRDHHAAARLGPAAG